jgi:hypothetical protein
MKRLAFASALVFVSTTTACMLNPVDGQVVADTRTWIFFNGYTAMPGQDVEVEASVAGDPSQWLVVAATKTSTVPTHTEEEAPVYPWSMLPRALPAEAWIAGTTGHVARLRLRVVGGPNGNGDDMRAATFIPDWFRCRLEHPQIRDFLHYCQSPNSPDAYVYTRDYPAGVDLAVTALRAADGGVEVSVRNGGRHGNVSLIACRTADATGETTIAEPINPGEAKSYIVALAASGPVTCTVGGMNPDGSAEANTRNNETSGTI